MRATAGYGQPQILWEWQSNISCAKCKRGWHTVGDKHVCADCFEDYAIQRFIRGSVTENSCSYCRRPDLTAKKFVPDPFSAVPGSRMYLTCDLARWGSDGQVEFGPD